jgi:hypothetical protein
MSFTRRSLGAIVASGAALALTACTVTVAPQVPPPTSGPASTSGPATATSGPAIAAPPEPEPEPGGPTGAVPPLPAGYVNFAQGAMNAEVPTGWTQTTTEDHTDFRDPSGQLLLRLREYVHEVDPNTYLHDLENTTAGIYAQYQLIRISDTATLPGEPANLPNSAVDGSAQTAAEWEFTFVKDGTTRRVIIGAIGYTACGTNGCSSSTFGTIYFSAPVGFYSDTVAATFGHARDSVYFAG